MTRSRPRILPALLALTGLAVGVAASAAEGPPPAPPAASDHALELRSFAARQWLRAALMDLRGVDDPRPEDFGVIALALDRATTLDPSNIELLRRQVEAAWNWGDSAAVMAATLRLYQADPTDSVAQLRLITHNIQQLQKMDERLAAYDRYEAFTDSRGRRLDDAIRSRLALDAALLCREAGDQDGFARRLRLAAQLDSTNKEAALLVVNFYADRVPDRVGRLELLSNLLYADPLDPNTHRRLAEELAAGGLYDQARRFHSNSRRISRAAHQRDSVAVSVEASLLDLYVDGEASVFERLRAELASLRADRATEIEQRKALLMDVSKIEKPEDVRLSIDFEPLRFLSALAIDDQATAELSLADMFKTAEADAKLLTDPATRPRDMSEEQAQEQVREGRLTAHWWRFVSGIGVPSEQAPLDAALAGTFDEEPLAAAVRAGVAMRAGDLDEARRQLSLVEGSSAWTDIAQALCTELSGDPQAAASQYAAAASNWALSAPGAFAHARDIAIRKQLGVEVPKAELAERARLRRAAEAIPSWVDQLITQPRMFQLLSTRVDTAPAGALDRRTVHLVLRNVLRLPMGLGVNRPVNSRFLFSPSLEMGGKDLNSIAPAEVIDLERRIRLMPGEQVEVDLDAEAGATGWIAETLSSTSGRLRWRVIQGFDLVDASTTLPGPACLEDQTAPVTRVALPEATMSRTSLAERISKASESDLRAAIIGTRASLMAGPRGPASKAEREAVGAALAARYPTLSPDARVAVVLALPPATELPELRPLDDAIASETDATALFAAVLTRADVPEHALIAAARASGNVSLVQMADLQAERLSRGAATYSRVGTRMLDPIQKLFADNEAKPDARPITKPDANPDSKPPLGEDR